MLLPDDFKILDVDWEYQRKILPERYIVRLDDALLDAHSYGPTDKVEERSPQAYELTKAKVNNALPLFKNIPLQIEHGVDNSVEPQTGFSKVYQNKSVVGKVVKAWINPQKDNELLGEVRFNNNKNSSLLWNYALHHTKANRGISLCSASDYTSMIPLEVSLVEKGMRPNTGVISVIDKDEKIINFQEYKLQHEETQPIAPATPTPAAVASEQEQKEDTSIQEVPDHITAEDTPSSTPSPPPSSLSLTEMQVAPASANQPRDPVTKKFISHAEAQARGIEPIPFTPAPQTTQQQQQQGLPPQLQQQMQQFQTPAIPQQQQQQQQQQQYQTGVDPAAQYATPGTFTTPMPPNPAMQASTMEYPMNTNFNGMMHTSMIGTPLEGIAMQEHARYQREAMERAQLQQQQGGFQTQQQFMTNVANASGGFIQPPVPPPTQQQQTPPQQALPPPTQAQQQQQQSAIAPPPQVDDSKMEDTEESQESVDAWFDKATEEEKAKEYASAKQKIMSGRHKELTKRENLVNAERMMKDEQEKQETSKKLLESSKEQKALMQTFISALSAFKPTTTAEEHKALEGLSPSQAVTQLVAAASSRVASLETQNQMYQQWMVEQNKRQKQEQSLPRHLQRIANQYAELSSGTASSALSATAYTPYTNITQTPISELGYQNLAPASAHMASASIHHAPPAQVPALAPQRPVMGIDQQKALLRNIMSGSDSFGTQSYYNDSSNYVPTSTPPQYQIAPASYRSGQKRTHESNQPQAPQQAPQDVYYPPDKNTVVDNDWLNHPTYYRSFTPALRESFARAGKYNAWNGYETSVLNIIAPDFVKLHNQYRSAQQNTQMTME